MDNKIIPFSFQKGHKETGCEDAPPISSTAYSVVCDGLGGSGSIKHNVSEGTAEKTVIRTSAYLGSRIVCDCVNAYYAETIPKLASELNVQRKANVMNHFLNGLKSKINMTFAEYMQKWNIAPSSSKAMKNFPTTLASAIYLPHANGVTVLAIWAGDSRIYALTPKKGLQLLSLDDAVNAENEMNSASAMTNCISAGNTFQLNYAFYELNEPGIVFCCSDGCFDYLPSPLNFEWSLLYVILERMPDSKNETLGVALAESIRDNVYVNIGDDTTMSGVIVGMDSGHRMKSLYQTRYNEFCETAERMNQGWTERQKAKDERSNADRACRLFEGRELSLLHDEVCRALKPTTTNVMLRTRLISMPCYAEYTQRMREIEQNIEDECAVESQKTLETARQIKEICQAMLVCDYLKWQRQTESQEENFSFWGWGPQKKRNNLDYLRPVKAKRYFLTCIELYAHPSFKEVVPLPALPENERDQYLESQVNQLESILAMLDNADWQFEDLWAQAYFSTDFFSEERNRCIQNPQIKALFEQAIQAPQTCQFASELTARKIEEYHEQINRIQAIRNRFSAEKERRLDGVSEEYWTKHKNEILDLLISENELNLREMFRNTPVSTERLMSYAQAKKNMASINKKIEAAQMVIDKIWNTYKGDYQLFQQIVEKGAY